MTRLKAGRKLVDTKRVALFGRKKRFGTTHKDSTVSIEDMVLEICRRLRGDVEWRVDKAVDAVVGEPLHINLSNLRAHYRTLDPAQRRAWCEMTIPSLLSGATHEELDRSTLRAVIRNRSVLEGVRLHAIGNDKPPVGVPHTLLTEDLCAVLVIDSPNSMMIVNDEHLDDWNATFEELWEIGLHNVRELDHLLWGVGDGRVLASHGDDYVAARLLLPELLDTTSHIPGLAIDRPFVAIPALRTTMYLTPLDDPRGLEIALQSAATHLNDAAQISFWPIIVDIDGSMRRLSLEPNHAAYASYRQLTRLDLEATYRGPTKQLQRLVGDDLRVAPVLIGMSATGTVESYAVWGDGETLIPNVDTIVFEGAGQPRRYASFADVWTTCSHLLEETNHYPVRWRATGRPDQALVEQIAKTVS